ncbi:MAG: Ig-like domain-containing protein, partial [Myxococcaceae bacterium]
QLSVEVVATDNVQVKQAELFVGAISQGVVTGGQPQGLYRVFSWSVAVPLGAAGGPLALRAVATNSAGLTGERSLSALVVADGPPTVSIVAPAPGAAFIEGEDIKMSVTVADDEGVVSLGGTSGGLPLPVRTLGPADVSKQQLLTVPAPIISKGQPPTVGASAVDTGGHPGSAEVQLQVSRDTEPPSALLTAPVPPVSGSLEVRVGGSIAIRAETGDNVKVAQVELLVDGTESSDVLETKDGRYQETRTPNPLIPGTILLGREYLATYLGTLSIGAGFAVGPHKLLVRVHDPAGNTTDTTELSFLVTAVVDQTAPQVTLQLQGTPDSQTCVAGSTIKVAFRAVDDVSLQSVSLSFEGQPVALPALIPQRAWYSSDVPVTLPALGTQGVRSLIFLATASDGAGRQALASAICDLVADHPPPVSILAPPPGSPLTEEQPASIQVQYQDDVGVSSGLVVLSTSALGVVSAGSIAMTAPAAAADGGSPAATLLFGGTHSFTAAVQGGAVVISPPDAAASGPGGGQVGLSVVPGQDGSGAVADVTYRYRVHPSYANSAETIAFLAAAPGGRRTVSLSAPDYQADLSFPPGAVEVSGIEVALRPEAAGAEPAVTHLGLEFGGSGLAQARASAAGESIAAVHLFTPPAAPGKPGNGSTTLRLPKGWAPRAALLSAVVIDTAGQSAKVSQLHPTQLDGSPPWVAVTSPRNGAALVAGAPFDVDVEAGDNVEVETIDLLVDGVPRDSARPGSSGRAHFALTLPLSPTGAPVALSAVARDRAGNASTSAPAFVTVHEDQGPTVTLVALSSAIETISQPELQSGFVTVLQGEQVSLTFGASDDVGVTQVTVRYDGQVLRDDVRQPAPTNFTTGVSFTPPIGAEGSPSIVAIEAKDAAGHLTTARLIIAGRRPKAPVVALASPLDGSSISDGSIQLGYEVLAGDDIQVQWLDLYLNGQLAKRLNWNGDSREIELVADHLGPDGLPIAADAT